MFTGISIRIVEGLHGPGVPPPPTPTPPHNTRPPEIFGEAKVGGTLDVVPGEWSGVPFPTITGQWYNFSNPIPGATSPKFTVTIQESNCKLSYKETATNTEGSETVTSNQIHILRYPLGILPFDRYDTNFARGYWNPTSNPTVLLLDGNYHYLRPQLATTAGPNGVVFADLAEMAAMGGVAGESTLAWFDYNGTLGKIKLESDNTEITASQMAGGINASTIIYCKYVAPDILIKEVYNGY